MLLNYVVSFVRGWTGWFLLTKSSRISIFNKSDIFDKVCKSGWVVFVHHLEMVTGSLPSCSANHLLVRPASASTALSLFKFSMNNKIKFWCKFNKLSRNNYQYPEKSSPYILFELFRFISPALYESEKKYSVQVAAVIYLLFILGVLMNKNTPRINRQSNVSNWP